MVGKTLIRGVFVVVAELSAVATALRFVAMSGLALIVCFTCLGGSSQAVILTFDDVGTGGRQIPAGYGGFQWDQFYTCQRDPNGSNGYSSGVVSGEYAAWNNYGNLATISQATAFNFEGAYFTAAWGGNLPITVNAYRNNVLQYTKVVSGVTLAGPQWVDFNWSNVDKLTFIGASGGLGNQIVMDDFTYNLNTLTWDGLGDGDWDYVSGNSRWLNESGQPVTVFPNSDATKAVVRTNAVSIPSNQAAFSLTVQSGSVALGPDRTLALRRDLNVSPGASITLGSGATLALFGGGTVDRLQTGGNAVISNRLDLSAASYSDSAVAGTLHKQGAGKLLLNNSWGSGVVAAQTTFSIEQGTLESKGADPLGGSRSVAMAGGKLSIGRGTTTPSGTGLAEWYFNGLYGDGQIDPIGDPSGLLALAPDATGMLDTKLSLRSPQISARTRGVTGTEKFAAVWYGQLIIATAGSAAPLKEGYVTLGTNSDDGSAFWVDLNRNGTFNSGEMIVNNKGAHGVQSRTASVYLAAGTYDVAIGYYQGTGDNLMEAGFGQGSGLTYASLTTIDPSSPTQSALWRGRTLDLLDVRPTQVRVTADSTLNAATHAQADFGDLTLAGGSLTATGALGGIRFQRTTVSGSSVGVKNFVDVKLGRIDFTGASPVTFTKSGPADLVLTTDNTGAGFEKTTWEAKEGRLVAVHSTNPFGAAALKLSGGEVVLSSSGGAVAFNNEVTVTASSTFTAGAAGGGVPGSFTITSGSTTRGIVVNSGTLELRSTDGYTLNVAGTLSGPGGVAVNQGSVILSGASNAIGTLQANGGTLSTAGAEITVGSRLVCGAVTYGIQSGVLRARGADLAHGADRLRLSGGQLTLNGTPVSHLQGLDIGGPAVPGSVRYDYTTDRYTVIGGGADIWGASDQFYFAQQVGSGSADIIALVENLLPGPGSIAMDGWVKSGVMIRQKLSAGSLHALTAVSPSNGVPAQGRRVENTTNNYSYGSGGGQVAPYWVRLKYDEAAGQVTHYRSADPASTPWNQVIWEIISQQPFSFAGGQYYIGLATTAHNNSRTAQGVMKNVVINGECTTSYPTMVQQSATDIDVTADVQLTTSAQNVTFGNLTLQSGTRNLTLANASYSFNDVTAPDGARILGELSVRGALSPGASPGTLSVLGSLNMDSGSSYSWDLGPDGSDRITVAGDLTLGATWRLFLMPDADAIADRSDEFTLFTYTGSLTTAQIEDRITSAEIILDPSVDPALWNVSGAMLKFGRDDGGSNRVYLTGVLGVPEPSTFVLLGMGALGLLTYAWRRRE